MNLQHARVEFENALRKVKGLLTSLKSLFVTEPEDNNSDDTRRRNARKRRRSAILSRHKRLGSNGSTKQAGTRHLHKSGQTTFNVRRRRDLGMKAFMDEHAIPAVPVIITDLASTIFPKGVWDVQYLLDHIDGTSPTDTAIKVPLQQEICSSRLWARLEPAGSSTLRQFLVRCIHKSVEIRLHTAQH